MELTTWIIMEHCQFWVGAIIFLVGLAFFSGVIGAPKPGWLCVSAAICMIFVPLFLDIIFVIFSHFWAAVIFVIVLISFFTKSGGRFWDNALIFGAAYRVSESVWDKFNDKK